MYVWKMQRSLRLGFYRGGVRMDAVEYYWRYAPEDFLTGGITLTVAYVFKKAHTYEWWMVYRVAGKVPNQTFIGPFPDSETAKAVVEALDAFRKEEV